MYVKIMGQPIFWTFNIKNSKEYNVHLYFLKMYKPFGYFIKKTFVMILFEVNTSEISSS